MKRKSRFTFDLQFDFEGFTDDSSSNGWANVWVTPETHSEVVKELIAACENEDLNIVDVLQGIDKLAPDAHGLILYAGVYGLQES